jgi:hypothetical protein
MKKENMTSDTWFENGGTKVVEKCYVVNSDITVNNTNIERGSVISIVSKEDGNTFLVAPIKRKQQAVSEEITRENLDELHNKLEYNEYITKLWNKLYGELTTRTLKIHLMKITIKSAKLAMWILTVLAVWVVVFKAQTAPAYVFAIIDIVFSWYIQSAIIPTYSNERLLKETNKIIEITTQRIGEILEEIERLGYNT